MPAIEKRKREENNGSLLQTEGDLLKLDQPFPRGGGSTVAPLDIKRAAVEATNDVFDAMVSAKKQKRSSKQKKVSSVKPASAKIEPLLLNKVRIGTLILGEITDINYSAKEFIVSLPNNLVGYCPTELVDPHYIGRWLRFIVVETGEAPKKRIVLSYDPELVNQTLDAAELTEGIAIQGLVDSVEEKGVVLNLGTFLGNGFLATKEPQFEVGEPIIAFIKNAERKTKTLTASTSSVAAAVINQQSLVPGTRVKAPVEKESEFGRFYALLGHITATSDVIHSREESSDARVLFSFPPAQLNGERQLGVSQLDNVLNLSHGKTLVETGSIVEVVVESVQPTLGLFVTAGGAPGFVHVSQIGSEEVDLDANEAFVPGTTHKARVISKSEVDDLSYLSLNPEVVNQRYLSIADVQIGDVVRDATVDRMLSKGGILVRLSRSVVGVVSEYQLSDVALKNPELRFKVGQKVAARVLNTDSEKGRVELTLKKSIVNDTGPVLASYEMVDDAVGTVLRHIDAGAKVLFYGGVKGLLPSSEVSETGSKSSDVLRVGQTVKVRVIEADASRDRLIVSMRAVSELSTRIGEVHEAIVSTRNKHETRVNIEGIGDAVLVGSEKHKLSKSFEVKILTTKLATADPALVNANVPRTIDDLTVGQQIIGFVSGLQEKIGIFVGFLDGLVGLIPSNVWGSSKLPNIGDTIPVIVESIDFSRTRFFLSPLSSSKTVSATITAVKATQLNVTTEDGQQGRVDSSQLFNSLDDIEDPKHPLAQFKAGQKLSGLRIIGRHDAKNHRFLPLSHRSGTHVLLELSKRASNDIKAEEKALAFVNNFSDDGLSAWVTLSPTLRGQLSLVDLSYDTDSLDDPLESFPIGSVIEVKVLKTGTKLALTALTKPSNLALVFSVHPLRVMVRLPYHKTASITAVDTGDKFEPLKKAFDVGQIVQFRKEEDRVVLRNEPIKPVVVGETRQGFVWNIASGGVFVALAPGVIGRVQIGQLSDSYLKNWQTYLNKGDVVTAKVIDITQKGFIELSLKESTVTGKKQPGIDRVNIGDVAEGIIRRVESFGVFVDFNGVTGLCHKSEISEHVIDDLSRVFKTGDSVKVKVLRKDEKAGKLSLGMKAAYFQNEPSDDSEDDAISEDNNIDMSGLESESDAEISLGNGGDNDVFGESSSSDDSEASGTSDAENGLSAGFNWSGDLDEPAPQDEQFDSDSESDSDDEPRRRKNKRKERFTRDETASLQTRLPQSAKDFERLLVTTPGSSMLWINYMAFQLQVGEVDAARSIGRRALSSIPQREEEERLNVWVALLNLEAQFGTPETTERTFRESLQYMDALTMHLKMSTVFAQAGNLSAARDIFKRAHKRFGADGIDVWLAEMRFFFTTGGDKTFGRALADRALERLPTRLHRDFTRQFALLEFELGDPERGRTLIEALLSSAPKRIDIWNVYVDQEIKQGDESKITNLFERILQQKLSMKQAKFFFKKWIGVASDQEFVKKRARDYVEARESD